MKKLFIILGLSAGFILPPIEETLAQEWFQTGQEANIILGPYANSCNSSGLHHPARAMSDGTHLYVADTRNNRILIWNTIPTINNQPADVVVGQADFTTNDSRAGATGLNWPVGVFSDGIRLFVTDTENHRVLIWNQIPTTNGEPANLVLGQPDFDTVRDRPSDSSSTRWPWDVHYDGTRLYVVCTAAGRVLVWNSLPTQNNQPANMVLGHKDFTNGGSTDPNDAWLMATPRAIATDGTRLAISDYNFHRILVWNTIPTQNGQEADIILHADSIPLDFGHGGLWMHEDTLFLAGNTVVYIWEQFPIVNNQPPDRVVGEAISCMGSGLWGVSYDGQHLYVTDTNGARVLIYNQLPPNPDTPADVVLGQPDFETNIFLGRTGVRSTSSVASTGGKLFISVGCDRRIVVHQDLPEEDGEEADNIIATVNFGEIRRYLSPVEPITEPGQVWSDGVRLFAIDKDRGILIWNRIPTEDKVMPDRAICPNGICGSITLNQPWGMTISGEKLFVCDTGNRRILIWNSIPQEGESHDPDIILNIASAPYHIATDGERVAVAAMESGVLIWNTIPTINDQPPDITLVGHPMHFNIPQGVFIYEGMLFVGDTGFDRVCIYNTFPTASDQPYDIVIGQPDLTTTLAGKSRTKMNMPRGLWFDGEYLWVSEFKFADRVLGFKANIDSTAPASPSNLQATPISNNQINLSWQDNASNERGFITKYKKSDTTDYSILYLNANTTSFHVTGLEKNTQYSFIVAAYNSYSESVPTDTVEATTLNEGDNPPMEPSNPSPANGEIGVCEKYLALKWTGGDPDIGDCVTYDLYFGTASNPPLYSQGQTPNYYNDILHQLAGNTTHYWKVVAKDLNNAITESPIWNFKTAGVGSGWNLTISSGQGGTTNPCPSTYKYNGGASALVYAIPTPGYLFSGWTGDTTDATNPISVVMKTDKSITANFTVGVEEKYIPKAYKLLQNFPDPFNSKTTIGYELPNKSYVNITIYDIAGREVKNLVSGVKKAGGYSIVWDGKDNTGKNCANGVYFYKFSTARGATSFCHSEPFTCHSERSEESSRFIGIQGRLREESQERGFTDTKKLVLMK